MEEHKTGHISTDVLSQGSPATSGEPRNIAGRSRDADGVIVSEPQVQNGNMRSRPWRKRLARLRTLWAEPSSEQKSAIAPGPYGAWLKSVERENARRGRRIRRLVEFSVVIAAIALVIPSVHDTSHGYAINWVLLGWAIGLGVTGGVVLVYDATNYKAQKSSYMNDWRREAVYEPLERIKSDVGPLIMFNQRRIDQYHELTLSQAAVAERNSQFAMAAGLVVIIGGIVVSFIGATNTTARIVTGSLTGVGGVLSGYITKTFLKDRRTALSQLNHYFQQPLTTGYLLTAERLASKAKGGGDAFWQELSSDIAKLAFGVAQPEPQSAPSKSANEGE